jgi:hypothetical protein
MAERIEGLGAAPAKRHDHVPKMTIAEQELHRLERDAQAKRLTQASSSSSEGYYNQGGGAALSKKEAKVHSGLQYSSNYAIARPPPEFLHSTFLFLFSLV